MIFKIAYPLSFLRLNISPHSLCHEGTSVFEWIPFPVWWIAQTEWFLVYYIWRWFLMPLSTTITTPTSNAEICTLICSVDNMVCLLLCNLPEAYVVGCQISDLFLFVSLAGGCARSQHVPQLLGLLRLHWKTACHSPLSDVLTLPMYRSITTVGVSTCQQVWNNLNYKG